jgi:hypothetical protein
MPALVSASLTSSNLNGFTIASTIFIKTPFDTADKTAPTVYALKSTQQPRCQIRAARAKMTLIGNLIEIIGGRRAAVAGQERSQSA